MTISRNLGDLANNVDSSGTLGVAGGGTGSTSLTANAVLLGNTTSSLKVVSPGTSGNVLTSDGTTWNSVTPAPGLSAGKAIAFAIVMGF